MKILNQGFDHVEFAVKELGPHVQRWQRMGFEQIGKRDSKERGTESVVMAQGYVRIMLTAATDARKASGDLAVEFQKKHDDGICVLAVDVDDATRAFEKTVAAGARPAMKPKKFESRCGTVVRSEIYTPDDVRYAFIERHAPGGHKEPALFDDGLEVSRLESPSPMNIRVIDHLTNNVSIGEMAKWVDYYKTIWDFEVVRHFKIKTGRTGLVSDVVRSKDGRITVPINEATEPESQVQEFVQRFKGPGVQHLALLTLDIQSSVGDLGKSGFKFLKVPHTYYEAVPKRVPDLTEDIKKLEQLQLLADGEGGGYLLQIFTEELVGPFFLEFIQRKGNKGFGEGNFQALFEAIERDQVKRGSLKI
ncbi:MAG TPA: 4-hydroxyphenylpyruvate dioxygenase [Bdellovibrionota bacterium]|nr:4-hydroxyphenylpyruvate dioxygenase [Bdellovibrionota bacterium]